MEPLRTHQLFGKEARVFPFRPNWAEPVVETLEWKTDIIRSRDGTEQRRALRRYARRGFEFQSLVQRGLAAALDSFLFGWQNRYVALPVWTDATSITADLNTLDTDVMVSTATYGFQAGGYALLFASENYYDVINIVTVESDKLTISPGVGADWPAGSRILPLVVGHLNVSTPTTRLTSGITRAAVNFIGTADTAYPYVPDSTPGVIYDGIEVITSRPNWRNGITNEFTYQFQTVDAEVGPLAYFQTETTPKVVRQHQWFLKSRADILEFRKLAGRLRGQSRSVWMPSWFDDFEIAASNAGNQATVIIKGVWFHSLVGVDTSRDRLMITLQDGSVLYRRITESAPNYTSDITVLTLDSTLGVTVAPNSGATVRLLLRVRLATDKIVIPWLTTAVSEPQTNFTTVKL